MTVEKKRNGYHHGDLRRDLLRVAREEISRNGAQAVSLTSLARLAGVSQPAPYRHFADREALLEGVAVEGFEDLVSALNGALATCAPAERLRAISLAYVTYGEANTEIYRLMFASRLVPEAQPESALSAAADNALGLLRHVLSSASLVETLGDDAYGVWARLHGLVMLKADGFIKRPLSELVEMSDSIKPKRRRRT
ncbi:TetR/AcrR family transcriptional regulator [Burkholderia sp. PAMC 26561]|uniref:TetR/AcrR family transcriptional regulator n=1 Tax=Burkholderia sp. PAMC 26561 TaxID=1795043 RepID=UPI00076B2EC9|nr:TetR/AcrR family transcriptional regulator [Burkholderia sp. PAMC 26561]AME28520.1 transcriptional regulator [Burkholderia sp. PAMC 26561]